MAVAKVFRSGNSQAVRLPKQFRVLSDELEIFRRGDEIVLREKPATIEKAFHLLCEMPEGMLDARDDPPAQDRDW